MGIDVDSIPVTVLMPVFNAERYVADAVRSILDQSYRQFEFLIVNDGSTDASRVIIQSFGDPRIRIVDTENLGVSAALRRGINEARGEYIARMDADDIASPDRLALEKDVLDRYPEVVVVHGAIEYIDEKGRSLGIARSSDYDSLCTRWLLLWRNVPSHSTVMIRAACMHEHHLNYRLEVNGAEDFELWGRLAQRGEFRFLRDVMLRYRTHPESVTKAGRVEKLLTAQARVIREAQARFRVPLSDEIARELAVISGGSPIDPRRFPYRALQGQLHQVFKSVLGAFELRYGPATTALRSVQAGQVTYWAHQMVATSRRYAIRLLLMGWRRYPKILLQAVFWKALLAVLLPHALVQRIRKGNPGVSVSGPA